MLEVRVPGPDALERILWIRSLDRGPSNRVRRYRSTGMEPPVGRARSKTPEGPLEAVCAKKEFVGLHVAPGWRRFRLLLWMFRRLN